MSSPLQRFKARAFKRPEVKSAYEALADEFAFIDELLKARASAGLTQAQLAERIGTTQSAVARLRIGQRRALTVDRDVAALRPGTWLPGGSEVREDRGATRAVDTQHPHRAPCRGWRQLTRLS
ncbi:MAG: helix-turn-helix domain-containing protein [Burkholderiaceae bacterium]|nr:helix-turn-helix domain-containing protein [Burkholderiaceae bacterium]